MMKNSKLKNEGTCYCDKCQTITPYSTYTVPDMGGWVDGRHYVFAGKQARCNICTKMVFPEEIKKFNQKILDEVASGVCLH